MDGVTGDFRGMTTKKSSFRKRCLMVQPSTVKQLFLLCAMGTMAACAPGDCDPRQKRSLLTAGGCLATGGTDAFLDQMREEYAQLVEAKRLSDIEQRSLDCSPFCRTGCPMS